MSLADDIFIKMCSEILESCDIAQQRDHSERTSADKACRLMLHLHASQSQNEERQQRQKHDKNCVTIHNYQFSIINFQLTTIPSYSGYCLRCHC